MSLVTQEKQKAEAFGFLLFFLVVGEIHIPCNLCARDILGPSGIKDALHGFVHLLAVLVLIAEGVDEGGEG